MELNENASENNKYERKREKKTWQLQVMSLVSSHRDADNTPCTDTHEQVYNLCEVQICKFNQLPDPGNHNDRASEVRSPGQGGPRV